MKAELILQSDLLDIIFENRNKQYGAYQLRKEYNGRLYRSLYLVLAIVGLLIAANLLAHFFKPKSQHLVSISSLDSGIRLTTVPIPETPPPVVKLSPPVASIRNMVPVIVPDDKARDTMPTIDVIADRVISDQTVDGPKPVSDNVSVAPKPVAAPAPAPVEPAIVDDPEVLPEFPGGTAALLRFLGRNLQVPEDALEAGQRVKIPVRFVVSKDGSLGDLEFPVQADERFKKEIQRVVSRMPKWKPGSVQGKTVSVHFTIPIIFETTEN